MKRRCMRRPEEAVALLRLAVARGQFLRGHQFLLSPSGTDFAPLKGKAISCSSRRMAPNGGG